MTVKSCIYILFITALISTLITWHFSFVCKDAHFSIIFDRDTSAFKFSLTIPALDYNMKSHFIDKKN